MDATVSMIDRSPEAFLKSWIAEMVGTFFLLTAILAAPAGITFAAAGVTLLVLVVALGKTSGAHLNPAVTTGLVVARRFPLKDGAVYVVAQIIGALLAIGIANILDRQLTDVVRNNNAFIGEMLGAFLLVFVVAQVTFNQVPETGSALGIGLALAVGILIAGSSSGGIVNPAIGLALLLTGNVAGFVGGLLPYLVAPLISGVLAGRLADYLAPVRVPENDPRRGAQSL